MGMRMRLPRGRSSKIQNVSSCASSAVCWTTFAAAADGDPMGRGGGLSAGGDASIKGDRSRVRPIVRKITCVAADDLFGDGIFGDFPPIF
jgi:hypothetical protein